ncbi:hypothetical protein [Plantactinospora sp. WMMB782]|uniref:hypothetical protein n=1 Tax=Plantactinospora sp. WMMB782 TaxID=3404121 RepID=UPI003B94579F
MTTAGANRTIRPWNITQPTRPVQVATLRSHTDEIHACVFSPDGDLLANHQNRSLRAPRTSRCLTPGKSSLPRLSR